MCKEDVHCRIGVLVGWISAERKLIQPAVNHCPGDALRCLSVCENQFCRRKDRHAVDRKMQRLTAVVVMGAGF